MHPNQQSREEKKTGFPGSQEGSGPRLCYWGCPAQASVYSSVKWVWALSLGAEVPVIRGPWGPSQS